MSVGPSAKQVAAMSERIAGTDALLSRPCRRQRGTQQPRGGADA
jgi:hypothetical protein